MTLIIVREVCNLVLRLSSIVFEACIRQTSSFGLFSVCVKLRGLLGVEYSKFVVARFVVVLFVYLEICLRIVALSLTNFGLWSSIVIELSRFVVVLITYLLL